jgi:glycine betaine/choline ABC-type transport system substrate-binding protein
MIRGKVFTVTLIALLGIAACGGGEKKVVIGSKEFTEQVILREMMAALIEGNSDIRAEQKFLGGTLICFNSLQNGQIDLYAEYTGTALTEILKQEVPAYAGMTDPQKVYDVVRDAFKQQYGLVWFEPLGFNNTYTLTMRRDQAQELGVQKISDLEAHKDKLSSGFTHEFLARPDGYPGLVKHYGWSLEREPKGMAPGLMYKAIAEGDVDLISGFATDGRIPAFGLVMLEDDKQFFPPYYAAPVIRADTLKEYPELEGILSKLAGKIDDKTMAELNYAVDEEARQAAMVAREFLQKRGLVTTK